jgi:hypothetical protein
MPPKATLFDIRYSICADRDVVNAAGLELVHDTQPELGALADQRCHNQSPNPQVGPYCTSVLIFKATPLADLVPRWPCGTGALTLR